LATISILKWDFSAAPSSAATLARGTRQTASVNARLGITDQFGIEPNISLNWLARQEANATVRVAGARATYTMTPRMFVAALVQQSSASRSIATTCVFGGSTNLAANSSLSTPMLTTRPALSARIGCRTEGWS